MILLDVNVLVYALRADSHRHEEYREWLDALANGPVSFGLTDLVLSGVLRVCTHPGVFAVSTPVAVALEFVNDLRNSPGCVLVSPGTEHWKIFDAFVRRLKLTGNRVPDAWLAALAIEGGYEWISTDGGFAKFQGLRWRHPLDLAH